MKVQTKGRGTNTYSAIGFFDETGLTVLEGSRIALKSSKNLSEKMVMLRDKYLKLCPDGILTEKVIFKSASSAAGFVTGNISNGLRVWKTEDGTALSDLR